MRFTIRSILLATTLLAAIAAGGRWAWLAYPATSVALLSGIVAGVLIAGLAKVEVGFRDLPAVARKAIGLVALLQLLLLSAIMVWISYTLGGRESLGAWATGLALGGTVASFARSLAELGLTWLGVENR